jgi:hypothetical protein
VSVIKEGGVKESSVKCSIGRERERERESGSGREKFCLMCR